MTQQAYHGVVAYTRRYTKDGRVRVFLHAPVGDREARTTLVLDAKAAALIKPGVPYTIEYEQLGRARSLR